MPKEDCKYWDKCYQTNEHHLQKYNHPEKAESNPEEKAPKAAQPNTTKTTGDANTEKKATRQEVNEEPKPAPKRKSSADEAANEKPAENDDVALYETEALRSEALGNIAGKNYMEILQKRIKLSVQAEYDDLLRTNEFIRHKFLVEMPPEFYAFWKFAKSLVKKDEGEEVLQHMEKQFQLLLVGPFEFLAGRFHNAKIREPGEYLRHWRFYYDAPEFQTIFVRKGTGKHYGYWRDTPKDKDGLLVARNDSKIGCEFEFVAGNSFDAFLYYLEKDFPSTPFSASAVNNAKKALNEFVKSNEVQLDKLDALVKARSSKVVTRSFHRAGIVVPVESKTRVGYRPLIVSDTELKKIIKLFEVLGSKNDGDESVQTAVMEKLQPVATAASIAVDECDFGTSLELGIDLFCSGHVELHSLALSLLVPAYTLLGRPQFIAIAKAHLEDRQRTLNLSIFDLDKKKIV